MIAPLSMLVSAISIAAFISVVSAFTTAPRRQLYVVYPGAIAKHSISCRSTTHLPATKTAEPALSVAETVMDKPKAMEDSTTQSDQDFLTIVPPNEGFRNTAASGEVSIASMNLLAPFYNSLQLPQKTTSDYERWEFLNNDRTQRVPKAIEMAKRTNADVLCLQEIEGGKLGETGSSEGKEFTLRDDVREWLAEPITTTLPDGSIRTVVEGYDSFVWSALNPNNKRGDVVGLCIAWRSKKHSLVEWQGYRRGMVCMLQEASDSSNDDKNAQESKPSILIANLHLPARPSNVLGRLNTMSKTIRKLSDLEKVLKKDRPKKNANQKNTIDGLIVVAGDFNSDQDSVAARLLSHGYTNYGNVRDRNYKAKVTKASASTMSHPYRFIDSYDHGKEFGSSKNDPRFKKENFRDQYAPVTVSLKGRGPGIMDHLFYSAGVDGSKPQHQLRKKPIAVQRTNPSQVALESSRTSTKESLSASLLQDHLGKRSKRRKKGEMRGGGGSEGLATAAHHSNNSKGAKVRVEAVLATIDPQSTVTAEKRLKIIHEGLPNLEKGFPSDHLPVGALFSAIQHQSSDKSKAKSIEENEIAADKTSIPSTFDEGAEAPEGVSSPADNVDSYTDEISVISAAAAATDVTQNNNRGQSSGVSSSVQRRRKSSRTSFGLRRRHNQVLNAVSDWLVGRGAASVVLDKPLYKNDLLARILGPTELKKNLKKKSRAPDLMCVFVDKSGEEHLVVVEVAVASDPDKVRAQKASKYKDLINLLSESNKLCHLATIVVRDDGVMPEGTRSDIQLLTQLTSGSIENPEESEKETDRLCDHLESKVSSFRIEK